MVRRLLSQGMEFSYCKLLNNEIELDQTAFFWDIDLNSYALVVNYDFMPEPRLLRLARAYNRGEEPPEPIIELVKKLSEPYRQTAQPSGNANNVLEIKLPPEDDQQLVYKVDLSSSSKWGSIEIHEIPRSRIRRFLARYGIWHSIPGIQISYNR